MLLRATMSSKTFVPHNETPPLSQIGAALDSLADAIAARRHAGQESWTYQLLSGKLDDLCKKVVEEAGECVLAAKEAEMLDAYSENDNLYDAAVDHLRYEAGDVIYHLLVLLERFNIPLEEVAAELNERMTDSERPAGSVRLTEGHVKRGK